MPPNTSCDAPVNPHINLIENARLYGAAGIPAATQGWLTYQGKHILAVGEGAYPEKLPDTQRFDAKGLNLLPGMVDIHIHGGFGHDVMDATPEALAGIAAFCAAHGVSSFLPTTLTNTREHIDAALANINAYMQRQNAEPAPNQPIRAALEAEPYPLGATVLGAHLEGPYLNCAKAGAQNPQHIRLGDAQELSAWLATGVVRLVALAPEYAENRALIDLCQRHGVCVAIAHSDASYSQTIDAINRGLSHSTHTFNAQSGLHHRTPGVIGAVLSEPDIACELIADGIHVHPGAIRTLHAAKAADKVILITDAVRAAGMPDGEYAFDDRRVVLQDGAVRLPDGTLAGSVLTMNRALAVYTEAVEARRGMTDTWRTTSANPLNTLGLGSYTGDLSAGKLADLVLLDDAYNVHLTLAQGRVLYTRG